MHHLLPTNLAETLADLSAPRLSNYRIFFNNPSDVELYGLYCWNDAISTRMSRVLGIVEILLRNRFHTELSKFAAANWSVTGGATSNNWYRFVLTDNTETARQIKKKNRGSLYSVIYPAHQVVAGMTCGFWPHLLDISNAPNGLAIPWGSMVPAMLPNHHQRNATYWNVQHHQDMLFERLQLVIKLRNRVAHHEPFWKFGDLKDEWRIRSGHTVGVVSPTPTTISEMLDRLRLSYNRITQLMFWMSKSRASDYMQSETHHCLDWLFSQEALTHYRSIGNERSIRLSSLSRSWGLKLNLRQTKSVLVVDKSKPIGRYYAI